MNTTKIFDFINQARRKKSYKNVLKTTCIKEKCKKNI